MAALVVEDLQLHFGGLQALKGVSFAVQEGQIFALIGPNGAGKTTIFNCISGLYRPQQGRILLGEKDMVGRKPDAIARMGLARTFQNLELFRQMTTLDNLLLGRHRHYRYGPLRAALFALGVVAEEVEHRRKVEEIIDFLDLEAARDHFVAALPYGTQKLVELGRALALEPRILLLDEPSAGMNAEEKQDLIWRIRDIRDELGITVLLVEHDMRLVSDICDQVLAIHYGEILAEGSPAQVQANPLVLQAYLGSEEEPSPDEVSSTTSPPAPEKAPTPEEAPAPDKEPSPDEVSSTAKASSTEKDSSAKEPPSTAKASSTEKDSSPENALLQLRNVETLYGHIQALRGVSLSVKKGQIVALLGANGAGKSTILKTTIGLLDDQPDKGTVVFQQQSLQGLSTAQIVQKGIAYVPEGREVFPELTVLENLKMGAYFRRDRAATDADLDRVLSLFPLLAERRKQLAGTLSGGEQQMLAIGRGLMAHPTLLLLDEPSLGLAPILVQEIAEIITTINKEGTTILLVEQNARMALSIAHYGYVIENGRVVLDDPASSLLENEDIREFYLGLSTTTGPQRQKRYKRKKRWR